MTTAHLDLEGELEVDGEETPVAVVGYVQADPRGQSGRLKLGGGELPLVVADTAYVSTDGEFWIKMTDEQFAEEVGTGQATKAIIDPLALVDAMADAIDGGSLEGEDALDDLDVTHYRVEVDADDYLARVAGGAGSEEGTFEQELWVDGEGRLARAELALGELGEVTLTLSQHGVERVIQAPPASETGELES